MIPITYQASGPLVPSRPVVYEWHYEPPRTRFVIGSSATSRIDRRVPCCGIAMMTVRERDRTLPHMICAYGADKPVEGPDDVVRLLNLVGNYHDGKPSAYKPLIAGQVCMGNAALQAVDRDDVVNAFWNSSLYWMDGPGIRYAPDPPLPASFTMTQTYCHSHWRVVSRLVRETD